MSCRLVLVCAGASPASTPGFWAPEPVADGVLAALVDGEGPRRQPYRLQVSPLLCRTTGETPVGSGFEAEVRLRDLDYGRWAGRGLADVLANEADAFAAWRTDPSAAPHGGESIAALCRRVAEWLDAVRLEPGLTVAATHAAVIRAAVLHVLHAPLTSFWSVDVAAEGRLALTHDGRRWALRLPGRRGAD